MVHMYVYLQQDGEAWNSMNCVQFDLYSVTFEGATNMLHKSPFYNTSYGRAIVPLIHTHAHIITFGSYNYVWGK